MTLAPTFLRLPQVQSRIGLKHTKLYESIEEGLFPPGVRLSAGAVGWPQHEVDAICRAKAAGFGDSAMRDLVAHLVASRTGALDVAETVVRGLSVATHSLNDAVSDHVVAAATRNGSTTPELARFVHYANMTARAIGLPKSNADVIAALSVEDKAKLALIRNGVAQRIPRWTSEAEAEGGEKPHNRVLGVGGEWAKAEAQALQALDIGALVERVEALR